MAKDWMPKTDRAALLEMCRTLRTEAGPRVKRMIERLAEEAENAERDTARVSAARAVIGFAVEGAKLASELESGTEGQTTIKGGVTVLVMDPAKPDEGPREPTRTELQALLTEVSESVRADMKN